MKYKDKRCAHTLQPPCLHCDHHSDDRVSSSDDDNVGPWQHPCFPSYAQSDTSCLLSECWYTDIGWATYNVVHSIQFTSPKVETPKESWYTLYRRWMGYIASLRITHFAYSRNIKRMLVYIQTLERLHSVPVRKVRFI